MNYEELNRLFHPKSIAIVGASSHPAKSWIVSVMLEYGFQGNIYPVNLDGGEVAGLKGYQSIRDIPDSVDYAFIQVPAQATLDVIKDCGAKGVKLATLFTAGFRETDEGAGNQLEQELLRTARSCGVRLLGPNCMGVFCPGAGLTFASKFPRDTGPVGVMCQSGGNSMQLVRAGAQRGLNFSKVISFGNAVDLNEAELMEYFAHDHETKIVIAYVEGVREGKRFFRALRTASRIKPVIIILGGRNEAGATASLSHTGSLSTTGRVWDSLITQASAIRATDIDDSIDMAVALTFMKPPKGRRVALVGIGGGASVMAADDCYDADLSLPPLSTEAQRELQEFTPLAGNMFGNPVDATRHFIDPKKLARTVQVVGNAPEVDFLLIHFGLEHGGFTYVESGLLEPMVESLIKVATEIEKPSALVLHAAYSEEAQVAATKLQKVCAQAGLPCYRSIKQAAKATSRLISYYENRDSDD